MTKPKKPMIPRQPMFLDESPTQRQVIYYTNTAYPECDLNLADLIDKHSKKNGFLLSSYDQRSIEIKINNDYGYDGLEFMMEITCDAEVDATALLHIQAQNKSLLTEWESRNNLYLEKLRLYEATMALWETSEAGQKANHAEQVRKLRAQTNQAIEKLTEQLKKKKITSEQFIAKMKDIEAIARAR